MKLRVEANIILLLQFVFKSAPNKLSESGFVFVLELNYIKSIPFLTLNVFQLAIECARLQAEHIKFHWKTLKVKKGILLGKPIESVIMLIPPSDPPPLL